MVDREACTTRQRYSDGIYSASKWPPNLPMCMHHELSYAIESPSLMLFACLTAPAGQGATPVANSTVLLRSLPAELIGRLERTGWLLVRNYNGEIGASLADAFGSDDRSVVEKCCRANAIRFEWRPDGSLRTWQRRSAIVRHPRTGQRCWFNQIASLSEWALEPGVREYLVDTYGGDGLPFNTCFGNGDPIGADIVQAINAGYAANSAREPWQRGDLMLIDNIRVAHGRERYEGAREVVVAMADAVVNLADCRP
jgi:hypothetical protein